MCYSVIIIHVIIIIWIAHECTVKPHLAAICLIRLPHYSGHVIQVTNITKTYIMNSLIRSPHLMRFHYIYICIISCDRIHFACSDKMVNFPGSGHICIYCCIFTNSNKLDNLICTIRSSFKLALWLQFLYFCYKTCKQNVPSSSTITRSCLKHAFGWYNNTTNRWKFVQT